MENISVSAIDLALFGSTEPVFDGAFVEWVVPASMVLNWSHESTCAWVVVESNTGEYNA